MRKKLAFIAVPLFTGALLMSSQLAAADDTTFKWGTCEVVRSGDTATINDKGEECQIAQVYETRQFSRDSSTGEKIFYGANDPDFPYIPSEFPREYLGQPKELAGIKHLVIKNSAKTKLPKWATGLFGNPYDPTTNAPYASNTLGDLETIEGLANLNTSDTVNIDEIFGHQANLEKLDVSGWDVSKVTYITEAFHDMKKLKSLTIKDWHLDSMTGMQDPFSNNPELTEIDLSGFKWGDPEELPEDIADDGVYNMFTNDTKLSKVDLTGIVYKNKAAGQFFKNAPVCDITLPADFVLQDQIWTESNKDNGVQNSWQKNRKMFADKVHSVSDLAGPGYYYSSPGGFDLTDPSFNAMNPDEVQKSQDRLNQYKKENPQETYDPLTVQTTYNDRKRWGDPSNAPYVDNSKSEKFFWPEYLAQVGLRKIVPDATHTGMWREIGKGTLENPLGEKRTSPQLTDGKPHPGHWICQPHQATAYVDENGNAIAPEDNDAFDKKDIAGYEFVSTDVVGGKTTHHYKRIEVPAAPNKTPEPVAQEGNKTPEKPAQTPNEPSPVKPEPKPEPKPKPVVPANTFKAPAQTPNSTPAEQQGDKQDTVSAPEAPLASTGSDSSAIWLFGLLVTILGAGATLVARKRNLD